MTHRITNVIVLMLFLMASFTSYAQTPVSILVEKSTTTGTPEDCADQTAGVVTLSNFVGQSNDIWGMGNTPDTVFLCSSDAFDLSISGEDLTGDPDMSTPAGVGYALYFCKPTVPGNTQTAITNDGCHYTDISTGTFFVSTGGVTTGDQTFTNTGSMQAMFGVLGGPVFSWVAPITFDALSGNVAVYENSGPCAKVSVDEAFPVVYLNPIIISNKKSNIVGLGCNVGSFDLAGGLPEYKSGEHYTVDITLSSNSSVHATLLDTDLSNGATIKFQVPQIGTYDIIVSDGKSCSGVASITMMDSITITLDEIQHESCPTGNDGLLTISSSGASGSANHTYLWNTAPAQTGTTIGGLVGGNYSVTVTDATGCIATQDFDVNGIVMPSITSFTEVDVTCYGQSTGSLTPVITDGNGSTYTYSWSNNTSSPTASGLSVGTYTVTITDEYGCDATATEDITASEGFFIKDTTFLQPSCVGYNDGTIIVVMEGSGDYNFAWDYNNVNTSTIIGVPAGTYNVTVSDNQSTCPAIHATFILEDPHQINTHVTLEKDVSCFDGSANDGEATCTAEYSDGEPGTFNFTWSGSFCNNTNTCTSSILGVGMNILAIDDGQCTVYDTVIVGAPDSILLDSIHITNVSCYGDNDGALFVVAKGGTPGTNPPYLYTWTSLGLGGQQNNVPAGNYSLIVTDGTGCSEVFNMVVDEPQELELTVDLAKTTDIYCNGESTGVIFLVPTGGNGTTGYTFNWSPDVSDNNIATELSAGTYSATVTDGLGCADEITYELGEGAPLEVYLNPVEQPECNGYQTVISIDTVIGGVGGPYTFSVDFSPPQSILLDYQVFADSHFIRVYDAAECFTELKVDIGEPEEIFISLPPYYEVELGDSIQLGPVISSSIPLDTFYWTPNTYLSPDSVKHPFVVGLDHDQNYEFTVIDTNGCMQTARTLVEVDHNRNVYIPNIFSPNNDGYNDVFYPKASIGVKEVNQMSIYDRWGQLIYYADHFLPHDNSPKVWDGSFRGKALDPGVFVYLIEVEFIDGVKLLYRGDITLIK